MAKSLGIRLQPRDDAPVIDVLHRRKIRSMGCLRCRQLGIREAHPIDFHHCRIIAPKKMGDLVSDYLGVPLCIIHHRVEYRGSIHDGNERKNWAAWGIDPAEWIATASPEGASEVARWRKRTA